MSENTIAAPTGTERPGEHWNARLIREQAEAERAADERQTLSDRLDARDEWARDVAVWHGMVRDGDDDLYATIAKFINALKAERDRWVATAAKEQEVHLANLTRLVTAEQTLAALVAENARLRHEASQRAIA